MPVSKNKMQINTDYLSRFIAQHKLNKREASEELGFNKDYITDSLRTGYASKVFVKSFCTVYGADYETLENAEPKQMEMAFDDEDILTKIYKVLVEINNKL